MRCVVWTGEKYQMCFSLDAGASEWVVVVLLSYRGQGCCKPMRQWKLPRATYVVRGDRDRRSQNAETLIKQHVRQQGCDVTDGDNEHLARTVQSNCNHEDVLSVLWSDVLELFSLRRFF